MAERYTRLFALTEKLYQSGAPVMIAAGALLKDNQTNKALAQIKLQSLSDKPIKAAKVTITPLDVIGNELGSLIEHQYLDLSIQRDEAFGAKSPIALPDATTRAFRAAVTSVVFADNSVWEASDAAWEPIPAPVTLEKAYPDAELRKQFKLEFGAQSQYAYSEFADLCDCPCGTLNRQMETKCHICDCDFLALRGLDIAELEKRKDERLEQERIEREKRLERERVEKEKALVEAAERAKKAKKIALITAPIICVVVAFLIVLNSVIIPNSKYNKAVSLMEAGQYNEAIAAFEAMDGYKDSAEKMDECAVAILETAYDMAVAWMKLGDYETAIEGFEILGEYRDCAEKIAECEAGIELALLDDQYDAAVALVEFGEYREAFDAFEALGNYKDSKDKRDECKEGMLRTAAVGDYVYFGSYEQDNNTSDGKEDIEWLVLDIQDGKMLILSKYALDFQPYNKERTAVTWETCTLREWLNHDFLTSAFTEIEQTMIPIVTVSADKNPRYDTEPGCDTQDKVFLLSIPEVEEYFASDSARRCQITDYADARGVITDSDGSCWWWLRSPGNQQDVAASVYFDGGVYSIGGVVNELYGYTTYISIHAIRPAIWVEIGE